MNIDDEIQKLADESDRKAVEKERSRILAIVEEMIEEIDCWDESPACAKLEELKTRIQGDQ